MRQSFLLVVLVLSGCRYLSAPAPSVGPGQDRLLSSGDPTEPGRQPANLPENTCGVVCSAGFRCDAKTARCVPEASSTSVRDGGAAWLP
jgi:hypothetical protein